MNVEMSTGHNTSSATVTVPLNEMVCARRRPRRPLIVCLGAVEASRLAERPR